MKFIIGIPLPSLINTKSYIKLYFRQNNKPETSHFDVLNISLKERIPRFLPPILVIRIEWVIVPFIHHFLSSAMVGVSNKLLQGRNTRLRGCVQRLMLLVIKIDVINSALCRIPRDLQFISISNSTFKGKYIYKYKYLSMRGDGYLVLCLDRYRKSVSMNWVRLG